MKKPIFPRGVGAGAAWVVVLLLAVPLRSPAATPDQNKLPAGAMIGNYVGEDDYSIDLHSAAHVFEPGHRIAVQVQGTWFPLIDRNPQTFQPSIFKAERVEFKAQAHSVFHTGRYPSAIVVDVATGGGSGER